MSKKTPIGSIGKDARKVTIADELEITTRYHIDPSLTPSQLYECWLEPSDVDLTHEKHTLMYCAGQKSDVGLQMMDVLKNEALKPEALAKGIVVFKEEAVHRWARVKNKVLRKFNLSDLRFNSLADNVHFITISSRQPLYDQDAHPNRIRNVLRAVKVRYPHVHFEHEGCDTSGSCPIGLQEALRKLAEETHGKSTA
jgi:hypothetical protein